MSYDVTCPSGLQVRIRGLKVKEEKIITNEKKNREGKVLSEILQACTEELLDPARYTFENIKWSKLLQGDRVFMLLKIREATYGSEYEFGMKCSNRRCQERFEWEVDLNDLKVKPLPENVSPEDIFEVTLPESGRKVSFHLGRAEDEETIRTLSKKLSDAGPITIGLLARIESIEGVDKTSVKAKREFIEDLEMDDVTFLREEFDRYDCGIETGIEVECPSCGEVQEIDLPLGREFFLPMKRAKSRQSSKESSLGSTSKAGETQPSLSAGTSTAAAD